MDESKDTKLQEKIKNYFEKLSYGEKYNFDIVITTLAILFVVYVVFYVYFSSRINLEKINWEKNKCNPFYMPFAQVVNDGGDGFNGENLKNCLNDLTSNLAFDILAPINVIANFFSQILEFLASMFSNLLAFIMHLYNLLVSLFRELMLRIERIVQENVTIFSKINNFIGSVLGFITLIYYQIVILVDSIKLIFPMMALSFLIGVFIPTLLALVISIIFLAVFYAIAVFLSPILCIGCWAWAPVAVWVVVSIFLMIFFILILVLYIIFANTCNDILVRILRPVTQDDSEMTFKKPPGA
tara:strand:+ start:6889 stop:7782 length:894 start_codon:yes stop_codon:yes gene_type:complete